jgi:hypothetical protein
MKKIVSLIACFMAIFAVGFATVASGPFVGVEQEFFGDMNIWAGYKWVPYTQTASITGKVLFGDVWAINGGPTLEFDLASEYDFSIFSLSSWTDIVFVDFVDYPDTYVGSVDVGGRFEVTIAPSPCGEGNPCYNPNAIIYIEGGMLYTADRVGHGPNYTISYLPWGAVGFEVFF